MLTNICSLSVIYLIYFVKAESFKFVNENNQNSLWQSFSVLFNTQLLNTFHSPVVLDEAAKQLSVITDSILLGCSTYSDGENLGK